MDGAKQEDRGAYLRDVRTVGESEARMRWRQPKTDALPPITLHQVDVNWKQQQC